MMSLIDLGKQLLEAAKLGLTDQVRLLMSNGAPFTTDWLGNSALHFTAQYGHLDTSEALMRAGISRDARTKVDRTPLHLASQEGHLALVSLLITNGADINAVDMLRMTPLHWAVEKGHTDVVQFLLNHGAAVNAANKFSKTPVDIAYSNDRSDLIVLMQNSLLGAFGAIHNDDLQQLLQNLMCGLCETQALLVPALRIERGTSLVYRQQLCVEPHLIGSAAAAEETNEGVVEEVVDSTSSAVLSTDGILECERESSSAPAISVLDCADQRLLISDSSDGLLDPSVSPSSHRLSTSKSKAASTGKQRHARRLATLADLAEATSSSSSSKSQSTMSATDTLSWLETHGVVLADQSNMFTSMLESGQMVVLTEAGNLILNTACNLSDNGDVSVQDDTTVTISADAVLSDCDQNDACASSLQADDYTHDVQQSVQQSYSRKRKSAGNEELDSHLAHVASDNISDGFNSKVTKLHAVNS